MLYAILDAISYASYNPIRGSITHHGGLETAVHRAQAMRNQNSQDAGRPPVRRRRTASAEPLQKMSFQLHASVADAIRAVVKSGEAPSANVFVEEAVKERLRERRREKIYAAYAEAAQDPEFMAEMLDTDRAFDVTVGDGL